MRHLNYNHLLYFWTTVREGGVAAAAASLHLTPQTLSSQIKLLESQVQGALLEKRGRRLVPTELGLITYAYAEDIFAKGLELGSVLRGARPQGRRSVTIGVSDSVPKLVTWRILAPLLHKEADFHLICHESPLQPLLVDLAAHKLDLVLSTSAIPANASIKAFSHLLGESELGFFASKTLAKKLRKKFPESLHGAPMILPTDRSANRRVLDDWLQSTGIAPYIAAELDDTALTKTFAQYDVGAFAAPLAIEREITEQFILERVGVVAGIKARFYALSTERRIKHPAVAMITERARSDLFH
jgi:LysR family transcriptional activator of nhaA